MSRAGCRLMCPDVVTVLVVLLLLLLGCTPLLFEFPTGLFSSTSSFIGPGSFPSSRCTVVDWSSMTPSPTSTNQCSPLPSFNQLPTLTFLVFNSALLLRFS